VQHFHQKAWSSFIFTTDQINKTINDNEIEISAVEAMSVETSVPFLYPISECED
jgi:hypothetical protein